ncbi:hypothetical protein [Halomonas caseinilytica]|uniref:hypothetical protein n=1 Tax=Halomonas caseinilytica TaxID=438744 RepID=UPI0007E5A3CE|nr:hypothetical protein [Halomonas caseinilytica]SEN69835.1 hypothetical protein SAMN04487952_1257 [Halomonas caseinilytica]
MEPREFDQRYDGHRKCHVLYRRPNGDRVKGLLLDDRWTSLAGHHCVSIDNWGQSVLLEDVFDVIPTSIPWLPDSKR